MITNETFENLVPSLLAPEMYFDNPEQYRGVLMLLAGTVMKQWNAGSRGNLLFLIRSVPITTEEAGSRRGWFLPLIQLYESSIHSELMKQLWQQ